jgi:glycosyltransferase involved in cell wall biosynthesis
VRVNPAVALLAISTVLLAAVWIVLGVLLGRAARNLPALAATLDAGAPLPGPPRLPSLSVVVTARDEAASIGTTVRRLLAQRYPGLEVIAVDDRSSDGTAEILDRLKSARAGPPAGLDDAAAPDLTVLHIRDLPRGWLGKCHACHTGASRARGEWILFLDGDVELADDELLARVVALAEEHHIDHIAVIPDQRPVSPMQAALLAVFAQMYLLAARLYEMHRDLRRGGAGIGAFNLVRRAAYDRIQGHTLLKMDPTDDFKLGRLLKESGARQRFFDGVGLVRCPWHRGALNVARGLEKNFFAGFAYSVTELIAFTGLALILVFGPAVVGAAASFLSAAGLPAAGCCPAVGNLLTAGPGRAAAALLGWLPMALQALVVWTGFRTHTRRHGGNPVLLSALYPAAVLLLLAAAWNSAVRILARRGILWRDTFYPLAELRAGLVREGAGRSL